MSKTECPSGGQKQGGGKCFKGVENFLKRVAFNLGNTPSRTEVKIISCIPIDVSDLQQKILFLERQLDEIKPGYVQRRIVNTVLCDTKFSVPDPPEAFKTLPMEQGTDPCEEITMCPRKSSFIIPTVLERQDNSILPDYYKNHCTTSYQPYADSENNNDIRQLETEEVKRLQCLKNLSKRKKKVLKHKKPTHYVYYAQTSSSPFNKSDAPEEASTSNNMTRSYLEKMIDKQYKPRALGGKLSEISKFSSPVCRDLEDFNPGCAYESDICSCCHGTFQNIDHHMSFPNDIQVYRANDIDTGGFYDSNFYDVIPVKEKPAKVKRNFDMAKKRERNPSIDMMCWPEDIRPKFRNYPIYNPLYFDYQAIIPRTDHVRKNPKTIRREPMNKKCMKHKNNFQRKINIEMSKSSCIDFGDVYPKLVRKKHDTYFQTDNFRTNPTPQKVDAECLTTATNNSECQTVTSDIDAKDSSPSTDGKTEETLNQIKSILQSVLHEVKVNSLSKGIDDTPKKDAVVQKGMSQGHMPEPVLGNLADTMREQQRTNQLNSLAENEKVPINLQGSRLLNSFTYSPYDIPPYLPSCSKQINSNQYYYPHAPVKCFQNFPLLVQNSGRHTCANCYRHSSHLKSYYGRQATTTATNTDAVKTEHSKETEKLIKEIYKSMALTMGVIKKDNSSEFEPINDFSSHIERSTRSVSQKPQPVKEFKKVTNVVQAVSELFRKKDMQMSSDSHELAESKYGSRNITENKYGSQGTDTESRHLTNNTTRSHLGSTNTDTDMTLGKGRVEKFSNQSPQRLPEQTRLKKRDFHIGTQNTVTTVNTSETSNSDTDTDTDVTFVPQQQKKAERKEKSKSLLSKMFQSVKLFKPRERKKRERKETKVEEPASEDSSSDSDDYQTIYSQNIETIPKHRPRGYNLSKRRTHSKISSRHIYQKDRSPERLRRLPYMEQEYRRHWNEKLTFHDKYQRHFSDHPRSQAYSNEAPRSMHPYHQTYETRAAFVEPTTVPRIHGVNAKRFLSKPTKYSSKPDPRLTSKAVPWLKKHKIGGMRCGEQWRKMIVDG